MHSTQENKVEQLLSIEDLSVEFISGENVQRAVNNISFSIHKGETLALVGESGSGKSVTAHSILRLLPYPLARHPSGKIIYQGKDLLAAAPEYLRKVRGNRIAMIFQEPMSSDRKSTRLNSSHVRISYAVFCLKKKNHTNL